MPPPMDAIDATSLVSVLMKSRLYVQLSTTRNDNTDTLYAFMTVAVGVEQV